MPATQPTTTPKSESADILDSLLTSAKGCTENCAVRIKASPISSVLGAGLAGYILALLPIGIFFRLLGPLRLPIGIFGAVKLYEYLQNSKKK